MSDRSSFVREWCIRKVYLYRTEIRPGMPARGCRFTPSCSTYALEALKTRRTGIALLMIAWRLLRCNPLTRHRHHDPIRKERKWGSRPNSLRTAFMMVLLTGSLLLVTSAAFGQSISSGCSGTVNGSSPTSLTASSPTVVGKGQSITVSGSGPAKAGGGVNGDYSISIVEGLFQVDKHNENWTGTGQTFQGVVNVDDYLKYGSGLYKVEGTATAAAGWSCNASFYVKLDGSKVIALVGTGVALAGGLGTKAAGKHKGRMKEFEADAGGPPAGESSASMDRGESAEGMAKGFGKDFIGLTEDEMSTKKTKPKLDKTANAGADSMPCLAGILFVLMGQAGVLGWLFPVTMNATGGASPTRVWIKGRPVLGFFSGLVFGLGATVALQQFGLWPLTTVTAIGFPIVLAIVGAVRGWRGTAFKL